MGDTEIEGDEEIDLDLTVTSGGTFANRAVAETVGVTVLDNDLFQVSALEKDHLGYFDKNANNMF